ncbi:MAG TPA: fused MFS/spermidine synthase [Thermodesulfobacteriota bacterium]|jgi:spermidine synthase|nr:fused MFS/spermidine synthase [Thermodesulfobacteriota bacterium]
MQREVIKANVVVFIASFCTLVIELVAGRIMAPYVGVSLYTWTSIIGVVLAGISIGAYLGGRLADRYPRSSTLGWLLFFSGLGAFSISPLTNLVGGAQFQTSLMSRILLITTIVFFIPSCLLGMISPVVVKLTLNNLDKTGNVVGKIYAFSTLGSILGTFATGFFLISWIGTRSILLTMGIILIISALVFGSFFKSKKALALFFLFLFLSAFLPFVGLRVYAAAKPAEFSFPTSPMESLKAFYNYAFRPPLEEETYFFKESNYYTIKLKTSIKGSNGNFLESLVLDHLIHSYTDLEDPLYLEYDYIRIYEEMVRWQVKKGRSLKALFLGGGGYTFPRFIDAKYPKAEIDVVEIDPEITRTAEKYLGVSENTKIRTFNEDGRWFVMNCRDKGTYDFIFGDAFNDLSIPYHLTTKEFAMQLKSLLKPDGVLMANVIDSFKQGAFMPSYIRTLEEVFGKGNVHLITLSSDYDHIGISTFVVVASPQKLDMDDFVKKVKRDGGEMTSHVMPQDQLQEFLRDRHSVILTDDYVPVDNLIAPIFEERFGYPQ